MVEPAVFADGLIEEYEKKRGIKNDSLRFLTHAMGRMELPLGHMCGPRFPGGTSGKEPTCQCRRHGFDP